MNSENTFNALWELEQKVWNAVIQKNGGALRDVFADDYVEVTLAEKRIGEGEVVNLSPEMGEIDRYDIDWKSVIQLEDTTVLFKRVRSFVGTLSAFEAP